MLSDNVFLKYLFDIPPSERGGVFELYCKWFLENDPIYSTQLKKIWLWKDWPSNWGRDKGIDLIAETHTGEFWAIQAKCYDENYYVTKEDVDKFLSESSRAIISYRLLICTTDRLGSNAREVIAAQEKQVGLCSLEHLLDSSIAWPSSVEKLQPLPLRQPKIPRPHQERAIESVLEGFKQHDKGQIYMACGTGKTLVGLWLTERLKSQNTLVLVPSISLVSQLFQEWAANATTNFIPIFVCSDPTVRDQEQMVASVYELGFPTTTDPQAILKYFSLSDGTPTVIFSTYHSSPVIKELCALDRDLTFDITIADEAHRCAGAANSDFATLFETEAINARRKLFMTATPKIYSDHVKTTAQELEYTILSMDDEEKFGPVFHKLPFSTAIAQDLLSDYEVLISIMDDKIYREYAEKGRFVAINRYESNARTIASQLLMSKAIKTYDLRRIITFHNRKSAASDFIGSFPIALSLLSDEQRPNIGFYGIILGDMLQSKRKSILKLFENVEAGSSAVLANVRCLSEGVDVPTLDGVAFIDPKGSEIEIIQAVGRAIRKAPNKKKGVIILPVFIDAHDDPEINLEDSCFKPIWKVLNALRSHDDTLKEELDNIRLELGKRKFTKPPRLSKVHFDLPIKIGKEFSDSLSLKIIEKCSSNNRTPLSLDLIIGWIRQYIAKHNRKPNQKSGIIEFALSPYEGITWVSVDQNLRKGLRGLPSGSSLAKVLKESFGYKNHMNLPKITEEMIHSWVDQHIKKYGFKPSKDSGIVEFAIDEFQEITWSIIDKALSRGTRGIKRKTSLAQFIEERFEIKSHLNLPNLTVQIIDDYVQKHIEKFGQKPTENSGIVEFAEGELKGITWSKIGTALSQGTRGCVGGKTLAQYIEQRFGIKSHVNNARFCECIIYQWIIKYIERFNKKPTANSGLIEFAVDEYKGTTWATVERALSRGIRGIKNKSSLSRFIENHFGDHSKTPDSEFPNSCNCKSNPGKTCKNIDPIHIRRGRTPPIPLEVIVLWIEKYIQKYQRKPTSYCGEIEFALNEFKGTTWACIDRALLRGSRGLEGNSSLSKLIKNQFGIDYYSNEIILTEEQICCLVEQYIIENKSKPTCKCGVVFFEGKKYTWEQIDRALRRGTKNLPGGSSVAKFTEKNFQIKNKKNLVPISLDDIRDWLTKYIEKYNKKPTKNSGIVEFASGDLKGTTWAQIIHAMHAGYRGLQKGITLSTLIENEFKIKKRPGGPRRGPSLSTEAILLWVSKFISKYGRKPTRKSGIVEFAESPYMGIKWSQIESAMLNGQRGLPKGMTLAQLIEKHFNVRKRPGKKKQTLTFDLIQSWVSKYVDKYKKAPTRYSGIIEFADASFKGITWGAIVIALSRGTRGLSKGFTLLQIYKQIHN